MYWLFIQECFTNQHVGILNVKTSEKGLQFGIDKCKSMIIGNQDKSINSDLLVDGWKQEYLESMKTGKYELKAS